MLELKAEGQVAKPTSGPETPADGAPYIFFVTGGAFEPVVTEVPPERKFNSADLFAFRRVRGDIVLSILMLAMALFLIASFAGETGWAKRKLPADMGQYIGIQLGLLDAKGRVARLGTILKQGWFAPMMCLVVMLPSAALNFAASWRATRKWKRQQMPPRWQYEVGQWARALDRLEKDRRLIEALNPLLVEAFLVLKRDEAKRLKNGHIDQIRDYYLPFL